MTKPVSLYIHIPFCQSRCGYCNFYSTTRLDDRKRYVAALCRAIKDAPLVGYTAATVYFGGGTPTLLGTGLLEILAAVKNRLPVHAAAEITVEANPGTVDYPLLKDLFDGGFNRISFGLQAADDKSLIALGRRHTANVGTQAILDARKAGFVNISGDIMLGTPGQTLGDVASLVQMVAGLGLPHVSAYLLKIEPDTDFGRHHVQRDCPDTDGMADRYLAACNALEAAGYAHYEISNFAQPGYESRHNTAYWQLADYLGIGPAAYSMMDGKRFHTAPDLDAFLESKNVWADSVSDGTGGGWDEYLMLSLRLSAGLSLDTAAQRYHQDTKRLLARAKPLFANGLAKTEGDRLFLTAKGFLVENSVILFLDSVV